VNINRPMTDFERTQAVQRELQRQQGAIANIAGEGYGKTLPPFQPTTFAQYRAECWIKILGNGSDDSEGSHGSESDAIKSANAGKYEWVGVSRFVSTDDYGNASVVWIPLDGTTPAPDGNAYPEAIGSYRLDNGLIMNPAIELNGSTEIEVGTICLATPGQQYAIDLGTTTGSGSNATTDVLECQEMIIERVEQLPVGEPFVNDSCETAPAYACMAVNDVARYRCDGVGSSSSSSSASGSCDPNVAAQINDKYVTSIWKPACDLFARDYVVNEGTDIHDGEIGFCRHTGLVPILYERDAGNDPEYGDELGPVLGQWYVAKGQPSICTFIGIIDAGRRIAFVRLHPLQFAELVVGQAVADYTNQDDTITIQNVRIIEPLGIDPDASNTVAGMELDGTLVVQNFLQRDIHQGDDVLARLAWQEPDSRQPCSGS